MHQLYRAQSRDTHPETDRYQFSLLRTRSPQQRLAMGCQMTKSAKALSLWGIKQVKAPETVKVTFACAILAEKWQLNLTPQGDDESLWIQDSLELARSLHPILESLAIPYYVTGGLAAIVYGEPRTTRDLDLVVQIEPQNITILSTVLEAAGYYCPSGAIEDIKAGCARVLSVTHTETINNADIIVNAATAFDDAKMARRRLFPTESGFSFWLISPEDLILAKLLWGQGVSEKQWRDTLGILKVQSESLDFDYLWNWGDRLQVVELLSRAFSEAGL